MRLFPHRPTAPGVLGIAPLATQRAPPQANKRRGTAVDKRHCSGREEQAVWPSRRLEGNGDKALRVGWTQYRRARCNQLVVEKSQGVLDELLGLPKVDDKPLVIGLATQHDRDDR